MPARPLNVRSLFHSDRRTTGHRSMPISTELIVRVAHADIAMHMAFPRSVGHWQSKGDTDQPWKVLAGDCNRLLIGKNDSVVIDGNCSNGVSLPDGGLIHIYGDLDSTIDANGYYEVIITGDVGSKGQIDASGFCHVFVGGRFSGDLRSSGSAKIWIGSDFKGSIKTGTPSTELHVGGDYEGSISPLETAALLSLTVSGLGAHALLSKIVDCGYTQFNASIARSDVPPGLYPLDGYHRKTQRGNSFNRWCVETENGK